MAAEIRGIRFAGSRVPRRRTSSRGAAAVFAVTVALMLAGLALAPPASAVGPAAPIVVTPSNAASVTEPATLAWTAVADPTGIIAYNWEIATTSSFATIVKRHSTSGALTDTVSGLADGTYFWHVQAVDASVFQGAWSATRSFTVTGAGPAAPGTPVLAAPVGGTAFHPFETIHMNWTAVPGAASYVFEADTNPAFPLLTTRVHFAGLPATSIPFVIGDFCGGCEQGNYVAHVYAVNSAGIGGIPSATRSFSVFYNNPLPAPPSPVAPVNGATVTLPTTFTWTDVPNPQDNGHEIQVARDAQFKTVEDDEPQLTGHSFTEVNLTPGAKFWRVRSAQGDNSANTVAETAWSAPARFTVSAAPAAVTAFTLTRAAPFSGENEFGSVQLSAVAPAGGATVVLSSSNPAAVSVPPSVPIAAGRALTDAGIPITIGQVTAATPVTLTATLGASSTTAQLVVSPASLKSLSIGTVTAISGGSAAGAALLLNGTGSAAGSVINLASSSPAATVPATITLESNSATIPISTAPVTTPTSVTITASWQGTSVTASFAVVPQVKPISLTFTQPSITVAGAQGAGTVTVANRSATDQILQVSSNNPAVFPFLSTTTEIPAGGLTGGISLLPTAVSVPTVVTVFVSGGGSTVSADITVDPEGTPPPPATLSTFTVNPQTVIGGTPATGTITLPTPAPAGGLVIVLGNKLPIDSTIPATVTVPAGASSVSFPITTNPVDTVTVEYTAANGATLISAALNILPPTTTQPPPGQSSTLTVTAAGRNGVSIVSSPAGINVPTGSSAGASYLTGSKITLSATDGRDAIWSGTCSSAGQKTKSCALTISGNSTETIAVQ